MLILIFPFPLNEEKRYTFILKDELLPPNPENGREQATISYETDFELPPQTVPGETRDRYVFIPFKSLNPTYRGKVRHFEEEINPQTLCFDCKLLADF